MYGQARDDVRRRPFEFAKLTWEEINEAVRAQKGCLLPAATIEDHGLHLPVDTDVVIVETICRRAAQLAPDEMVLLPCVTFGYSPHHIDGPGVLTIKWDTFINYVKDITDSLAYHGFRHILIVNGHGSNRPCLDLAARLTIVDNPDVACGMLSWWDLRDVQNAIRAFRASEWTGHACELETSVYLAVDADNVAMDKARIDINPRMSKHFWSDLVGQPPDGYANHVFMTDYWSTVSETGTWGDPTVATAEKGETIIQAAAAEIVEIMRELKDRPIYPRRPKQLPHVQERNKAFGRLKG
jgi:creatinine amidohydrolase